MSSRFFPNSNKRQDKAKIKAAIKVNRIRMDRAVNTINGINTELERKKVDRLVEMFKPISQETAEAIKEKGAPKRIYAGSEIYPHLAKLEPYGIRIILMDTGNIKPRQWVCSWKENIEEDWGDEPSSIQS
ncbi:hypothetical protein EFA69_16300 [Rufibacter immobilis]|uniref:Uncharacterized protein n=1 Tax=Rufibacter immobilis TaxID=1348778 RepID=A0A3M9MQ88_9BACT|nr:hypothetical protein [Rufibacter immobilis]RNI27679.1 hypothetical protein EFA69_16300 [Rufibacter immobilis]